MKTTVATIQQADGDMVEKPQQLTNDNENNTTTGRQEQ